MVCLVGLCCRIRGLRFHEVAASTEWPWQPCHRLFQAISPASKRVRLTLHVSAPWPLIPQVQAGVDAPLPIDLRLAGLVEAWAAGCEWGEVMADCSLDDGDIVRLLTRTADLLRQVRSSCVHDNRHVPAPAFLPLAGWPWLAALTLPAEYSTPGADCPQAVACPQL